LLAYPRMFNVVGGAKSRQNPNSALFWGTSPHFDRLNQHRSRNTVASKGQGSENILSKNKSWREFCCCCSAKGEHDDRGDR
jgi:hypothetical protein